jgi:hypothetical protein
MRREAPFAAAGFIEVLDLAADLRGLPAREVPLAFGFALLAVIDRPLLRDAFQGWAAGSGWPGVFEISRRMTCPFHSHNPVRTRMGTKTYRVGAAYCGMFSNGLYT